MIDTELSGTARMHLPDAQDTLGTELLRLARGSIEHGLVNGEPLSIRFDRLPAVMADPAATFTTLRLDGKLRGCVGHLESIRPLAKDVVHTAFQAAFRDPRFDPLGQHELNGTVIEVSVLSPMQPLSVSDEADLIEKLVPGKDGLVIVNGLQRATFLPKVWDQLPDPHQFVAALKRKCGLPQDYWSESLEFRRYNTASYTEQT